MIEEPHAIKVDNRIHFTYKENPDMTSLCQGDVIIKTKELSELLGEVHPYFLSDNYKYFMVLSQSCDLVRRGKKCKTPYITLAAVRDYGDFLQRILVSKHYAELLNGMLLIDARSKDKVLQFVERVYNNTESDYFFLYKEESLGFPKTMVAFLKVSIAIKSELHYDTCLAAKKLELSDEFKAKLGWLVGNMYSRVGTTDWESIVGSSKNKLIEDDIYSRCIVGYKEQLKELKKRINEGSYELNTHDEVVDFLSTISVKSKYEQVIDIIEETFNSTCKHVAPEEKTKFLNTIKSRRMIQQLIK